MKQRWKTTRSKSTAYKEKFGLAFQVCESRKTLEKRRESTELGQRYGIDASPAQQLDSQSSHHRARRRQKE